MPAGTSPAPAFAPESVRRVLARGGAPLPPATRRFFEPRFGISLAGIRVHTDSEAAQSADEVGALAYTVGDRIVFAANRFRPGDAQGDRLLAHELAHAVQGGAPILRRETPAADRLDEVRLDLVRNDPPTYQLTLGSAGKPLNFDVYLVGWKSELAGLRPGTYRITAHPGPKEWTERPRGVLFGMLDSANLSTDIWFVEPPGPSDNEASLLRARAYLLANPPVRFIIADATGKKAGAAGEGSAPRASPADPWLRDELLPAVVRELAAHSPPIDHGRLIPHRSPTVETREGTDPAFVQVERPGTKTIAGHARVLKSRWAGANAAARHAYVRQVAEDIGRILAAAQTKALAQALDAGLGKERRDAVFPAWAIEVHAKLEAELEALRARQTDEHRPDIPDRTALTMLGEDVRLHIFVQRAAADAPETTVWNNALISPALAESDETRIDGLMAGIRAQTLLLRARPVKAGQTVPGTGLTTIIMPAIPAAITGLDLNADDASIVGATNRFRMTVRIDQYFSEGGGRDLLNLATFSSALGMTDANYRWKVFRLTALETDGRSGEEQAALIRQLADRSIDQRRRIELVGSSIDAAAIMADEAVQLAGEDDGTHTYEFPARPGIYVVVCAKPVEALVSNGLRKIFPPSLAAFPVRIATAESLAAESVNETKDVIALKKLEASDPGLGERDRIEAANAAAQLEKQEGMSPLQLTQAATADIDAQISRVTALKQWLIADRKVHPTSTGTAKDDPLLVRLMCADSLHDAHHFRTFQKLQAGYGEGMYEIEGLAEDPRSEAGRRHVLNQHLALLNEQRGKAVKLGGRITEAAGLFLDEPRQLVATLILGETGQRIPLLLLVGQDREWQPGAYRFRVVDLTASGTPSYKLEKQTFRGEAKSARSEAITSAFTVYGEDNAYPTGRLFYRITSGENEGASGSVPNVVTKMEIAEDIAVAAAIVAMIASVAASGGATTPALAAVIQIVTFVNAAVAIGVSAEHIRRRVGAGTFAVDVDFGLEVVNILASAVGLGALGAEVALGRTAKSAAAAGKTLQAAQAMAKVERIGNAMLVFDAAGLGTTAVLTGVKVVEDIAAVKRLRLPADQERALLRQIAVDALMQGGMVAFQSVMLARSHLEMRARAEAEGGSYRSLSERGWIDSEGHVTETAPPSMRAPELKPTMSPSEHPPVPLDRDLKSVRTELSEGEKIVRASGDPEHDLSFTFHDENQELHTFKRRREDGIWCRYSTNPHCFVDPDLNAQVERAFALVEPEPVSERRQIAGTPADESKAINMKRGAYEEPAAARSKMRPMDELAAVAAEMGITVGELVRLEALMKGTVASRFREQWETAVAASPRAREKMTTVGELMSGSPSEAQRAEAKTLAREAYDLVRDEFWKAVFGKPDARKRITDAGLSIKEGNAPVAQINPERMETLTLEHMTRAADDPRLALDPANLTFAFAKENSVYLEAIRRIERNRLAELGYSGPGFQTPAAR